ncbi:MAG: SMI1/KNR4 family protein [Acidimicrobiales bacterium]
MLLPPLSSEEIRSLEEQLQRDLPGAFRSFLAQVGEGGPGPGYGIFSRRGPHDGPGTAVTTQIRNKRLLRERPKALFIGDLGGATHPVLVLGGALDGQMWLRDSGETIPLYRSGRLRDELEGLPVIRHDFVSWYSDWLDGLEQSGDQLVPLGVGPADEPAMIDRLARIGEIAQLRPEAGAGELVDELTGPPVVGAAALRALAVVDPDAARERARAQLDDPQPELADAAVDVFTSLAGADELTDLGEMLAQQPPYGAMPANNPARAQIETAMHRADQEATRQILAMEQLSELLGRPATQADVDRMREDAALLMAGDEARVPEDSLLRKIGFVPPTNR